MNETYFRIGHEHDALALLDEMIEQCEAANRAEPPEHRGMERAIGNEGFYWPRLAALRDAIARGVVGNGTV